MKVCNQINENIVDALLLAGVTAFLMIYFDIRYLFYDTVLTGGDTASWQAVAHHLAHELLPQGRLTGWDMGNFGGYPNFTFYFLPPFLLAVLPSVLFKLPLTVTLKWAVMSGIFLFPIAVYGGLRKMAYRFPIPIMGAGGAILMLFNESYTMFGGNALSTFAGEFCYMFAFMLLAFFIGSVYDGQKTGTRVHLNAILLGLIGLSHLFVFIPAVIALLAVFLIGGRPRYLAEVGLGAVALMAFWLLPLFVLRHPYTSPVYMIWQEFVNVRYLTAGLFALTLLIGPRLAMIGMQSRSDRRALNAIVIPLVFGLGGLSLVYLTGKYLALGKGLFYNRMDLPDYSGSPFLIPAAAQVLDAWLLPLAAAAGAAVAGYGMSAVRSGEAAGEKFYHRAGGGCLLLLVVFGVLALYNAVAGTIADESIRALMLGWRVRGLLAGIVFAAAAAGFLSSRFRHLLRHGLETETDDRFVFWLVVVAGSLSTYFGAHFLQVPDIRFLPPALYALMMILIAETLGPLLVERSRPVQMLGAFTVIYLAILAVVFGPGKAGAWFRYNNRGYELTRGHEDFRRVNQYLRTVYAGGDPLNAPRVAYEKCDAYGPYGGDRAFESLPLFSGRQTLEGIHYAGALSARSIAFLQTEFSKDVKTPAPLILSKINPAVLPAHFDLYNISQVVVMTDRIRKALSASPDFREEAAFGRIHLFRYTRSRNRYVDVPAVRPVLYRGERWADDFFDWFKASENSDVLLVPQQFVTDSEDRAVFGGMTDSVHNLDSFRSKRIDPSGLKIETRLTDHTIRFKTNRVGVPHLIKVSYFPNWKVEGARGVYPVSPHFMLVIPRQSEVVLTYGRTGWDMAGIAVTCGWMLLLFAGSRGRRKLFGLCILRQFTGRTDAAATRLETFLRRNRRALAAVVIAFFLTAATAGAVLRNRPVRAYETGYRALQRGLALSKVDRKAAAARQFREGIAAMAPLLAMRPAPDHRDVILAMLATAACHENLENFSRAEHWYRVIVTRYPYSRYVTESYVKLGRIYRRQLEALWEKAGSDTRPENRRFAFQEGLAWLNQSLDQYDLAAAKDPYSQWMTYARQDLQSLRLYVQSAEKRLFAGLHDIQGRLEMESAAERLARLIKRYQD